MVEWCAGVRMRDWKRWVAAGVTAGTVLFAAMTLRALPSRVPIHFSGVALQPDSYGGRGDVALLVGVGALAFGLFELGKRFPSGVHLPTWWTAGSGPEMQQRAGRSLSEMQLAVSLVFATALFLVEATARGWSRTPAVVLAYLSLAVLLVALVRSLMLRRDATTPAFFR